MVVDVELNGDLTIPVWIHPKASFPESPLSITHAVAMTLNGGKPLEKQKDYGYSDKGLSKLKLKLFKFGDVVITNTTVSVFDLMPAFKGMIPVNFLSEHHCVVDFGRNMIYVNDTNSTIISQLNTNEYSILEMKGKGPDLQIPARGISGQSIMLGIGVSRFTMLQLEAAKSLGVEMMEDSTTTSSSGKTFKAFKNKERVEIAIGGGKYFLTDCKLWDAAAYGLSRLGKPGEFKEDGLLGTGFMVSNRAVIDFGGKKIALMKRGHED